MSLSSLNRKLLRDLAAMRGQALAIGLVLACGIATFVMSLTTLQALHHAQDAYYTQYRFADIFAHARRAPLRLADDIAEIPGVAVVQTRIVADVTLDMPHMIEPARGRLISVPDIGRPMLNDVHLRRGRYLDPLRGGEALVSENFAIAHELRPGDSIRAIINGRLQHLHIVGVVLSPEYVLAIPDGDAMPDDTRFGVFWMGRPDLAAAFDMEGAFNDLTLTHLPGASEPEVIARLDRLLEPYGSVGAYSRADQISHRFLNDELRGLRGMAMVLPIIFLGVAAFLLNVVMTRLISTQREQIAALKAFGYSKGEIALHYLKFVLLIALLSALLGAALGIWLAQGLTALYVRFYRFPDFDFAIAPDILALGAVIAIAAAVAGTLSAVRRAVNLPPAEAMRPEPPARFKPTIIERLGLQRIFSQPVRMVLRQLERKPLKAGLSVLGIALAVGILVTGRFLTDALDHMIEFAFHAQQRQDVMITFTEPTSAAALHDARRLPGVLDAQPMRSVPVRIISGHHRRRGAIMGIPDDPRLYRVIDTDMRPIPLPPHGLVMTDMLAELLGIQPGDAVQIEIMHPTHQAAVTTHQIPLAGTVREYAGTNIYMNLDALHALLREDATLSGAFLSVDSGHLPELFHAIKHTPRIASVTTTDAMLRSFEETTGESQRQIQFINIIFACVIAAGVIYNTARISLSERSRELATLRVIGFTRQEISSILLGELAVLTAMAIPIGFILGHGFSWFIAAAFESESYRIPVVISRQTYAFATLVVVIAAVVSGLIVRRRLDHLDLVAVLKSKE